MVLTGSLDRSAQFWDVATGLGLGPPLRHLGPVRAGAWHPNGTVVLTGSENSAAPWAVPAPLQEDVERLWLRVQVATGVELKQDTVLEPLDAAEWLRRKRSLE